MERGYKDYTVSLTSSLTLNNGGNEIIQNLDMEEMVKFHVKIKLKTLLF